MELFVYDADAGIFTWRKRVSQRCRIGAVAGSYDAKIGYIRIGIKGRNYLAHRLAWVYVYGNSPAEEIDHIDGNKTNNAISNLREATHSQNCHNRGQYKNNAIGYKGVSRNGRGYQASIRINSRLLYLGQFDTPEAAHTAYIIAAQTHFGEFSNGGSLP